MFCICFFAHELDSRVIDQTKSEKMNFKQLCLICVLVVQVRSDCDDYFECLGDFIHDFLGDKNVTEASKASDNNYTELIDTEDLRNETVRFFDLSAIGKSITQALIDVTTLIKHEIQGVFNINEETDIQTSIENKTQIHAQAFSLSRIENNETTEEYAEEISEIKIPDFTKNNLTEFNEELSALKIEIEKNLQAEIDAFISKVLDNDSLDWVEVTENSFYDQEITTTDRTYIDAYGGSKTFSENFVNNDKEQETLKYFSTAEATIKTDKPISNDIVIATSTTYRPISTEYPTTKIVNTTSNSASSKTESNDTNTNTTYVNNTTNVPFIPVTTTVKDSKIEYVSTNKTDNYQITTELPKIAKKDAISTSKPLITITEDFNKAEVQTKAPIDYKKIENVKVNEISRNDISYYELPEDNATDYPIIDYVDLYRDTTNEEVDYVPTEIPETYEEKSDLDNIIGKEDELPNSDNGSYTNDTSNPASIFPWVAAIFIKNGTSNQFDYFCDGVLLSNTVVLTAARCVLRSRAVVDPEDVVVFLGKRSLRTSGEGESIHKVQQIKLQDNFTFFEHHAANDLAAIQLESPAVFTDDIKAACLAGDEDVAEAVTTAWGENISLIHFVKANTTCENNPSDNVVCAVYGNDVTLCPSYGGAYASRSNTDSDWCLRGIRTDDPTDKGLCFDKSTTFTDLIRYTPWLDDILL